MLTLILVLLGAVLYLNQAGLPAVLKRPLLDKLRARGIDLQFSRLHLSFAHGIVAENVAFGPVGTPDGPEIRFAQLVVGFNHRALLRRQAQIDSLQLRRGRLAWTLMATNRPPQRIVLDNVQTDLRFLADDAWALDNFRATFGGVRLQLAGTVSHASAVRNWRWFQGQPTADTANPWPHRLRQLADTLDSLTFPAPPELRLDVNGDALDPWSFSLRLFVNAPDAHTPWGTVANARFLARLFPPTANQLSRAEATLTATDAQTPWGNITNFDLHLNLASLEGQTNLPAGDLVLKTHAAQTRWAAGTDLDLHLAFAPVKDRLEALENELRLTARQGRSEWAQGSNLLFTARWVHTFTNPIPLSAAGSLTGDQIQTPWGHAQQIVVQGRLARSPSLAPAASANRPSIAPPPRWQTLLAPYSLDWDCLLTHCESHGIAATGLAAQGSWRHPALSVTNLQLTFEQSHLDLSAVWDVVTGAVQAELHSDADPTRLRPVLSTNAQAWLQEVTWPTPPRLAVQAACVMPPLTNGSPDWWAQVEPTLRLNGRLGLPRGATVKGISVQSIGTDFSLAQARWSLTNLVVTRPEGRLSGEQFLDLPARTFHARIDSTIDPRALVPLLPPEARQAFELLTLSEPPVIASELWGSLDHPERLGARGRVCLTNFAFRGEAASGLQTRFDYTNLCLACFDPHIQFGPRQIMAEALVADFARELVFLTNGAGSGDPMVVARAIGPQTARALAPFHFGEPPTVRGHGTIPMHGEEAADLCFEVQGRQFHWLCFDVPAITGTLRWTGLHLALGDVQTELCDGPASGSATLFFSPTNPGTDFAFALTTTNTDLKKLVQTVFNTTNQLGGRLSGTLVITNANSEDWRQTGGHGSARLQDGLIMDIPLFGILSKPLDNLALGIGSTRVHAGECSFIITNGVIRSDNLELRSPAMWLAYHGTTDLQGRVNARVEAEFLRDKPFVGPLLGLVSWPVSKLFEYKVTGPIGDPKTELLNPIPRWIFFPLHPLRTLKNLWAEEPTPSRTNAPPTAPP